MFGINNSIDRIINSSKGNLENTESQLIKNMKKESKKKPIVPKIVSTVGMSKEVMEKRELERQREIEEAEISERERIIEAEKQKEQRMAKKQQKNKK